MKPDVRQALRVFNKILRHGDRVGNEYRLDGLTAVVEQDGYTIVIRDDAVTLRVFFHHRFELDGANRKTWKAFQRRLDRIDASRHGAPA